jgi:AcrR family transcriptional regulator
MTEEPAASTDLPGAAPEGRPGSSPADEPSMRDRIMEAAADLFGRLGIRAVSAEEVIAVVGTTEATFYRHCLSKEDLVVAYLERRAAWERGVVESAREASGGDFCEAFRLIMEGVGSSGSAQVSLGCPFVDAASEYPDAGHSVRRLVKAHREWFETALEEMLAQVGVTEASAAAGQLMMLRDGAMIANHLEPPETVADSLYNASRAVINAHCSIPASRNGSRVTSTEVM